MRIIIAHNHYGDFARGGEGAVARSEAELLRRNGHDVLLYERTNSEFFHYDIKGKISKIFNLCYSKSFEREFTKVIEDFKPDILHVHNYRYIFTYSIFQAAKNRDVKTVLSLHNFHLSAPCSMLCRNGKNCQLCLDGHPIRTLWNPCTPREHQFLMRFLQYFFFIRASKKVAMTNLVDAFLVNSNFACDICVRSGVPREKIHFKPNSVFEGGYAPLLEKKAIGAVFVGRLSPEKGIDKLLEAWRGIQFPLSVVGAGPLYNRLKSENYPNVKFLGFLSEKEKLDILRNADFLIFPSVCYEGFPVTIIEAFACGIPVVATSHGARPETIDDGVNGFLYDSHDIAELRRKVMVLANNKEMCKEMGVNARLAFEKRFSPERVYQGLMDTYKHVLGGVK